MSAANFLMKMSGLKCQKCEHAFTAEDLKAAESQMQVGVLVCPKCQHLFSDGGQRVGKSGHSVSKVVDGYSAKIKFQNTPQGTLKFDVPWRGNFSISLFLFGGMWSLFSSFFLKAVITGQSIQVNGVSTTDPFKTLPLILPFFLVGFGILIYGVLQMVNKRHIMVSQSKISFFDGPLWSTKVVSFDKVQISNLSINRYSNGENNGRKQFVNAVNVHFKDGKTKKLCNAPTMKDAIFVEQTIEKYFGMADDQSLDDVSGM